MKKEGVCLCVHVVYKGVCVCVCVRVCVCVCVCVWVVCECRDVPMSLLDFYVRER